MGEEYMTPEKGVKLAVESIGKTILDKAEEISKDIDDVTKISIHSDIEIKKPVCVEISKTYIVKSKGVI